MITSGRKQLFGMIFFFAAVAGLGWQLFTVRDIWVAQQPHATKIGELETRIRAAKDPGSVLRLEADRARTEDPKVIAQIEGQIQTIKDDTTKVRVLEKELGERKVELKKLMPLHVKIAGWGLAFLVLAGFFVALNSANEHGRRFLVTAATALAAAGFFHFRSPAMGIDLRGGAELRYQLDTSAIDREIAEIEELNAAFKSTPEAAAKGIQEKIDEAEKARRAATGEVSVKEYDDRISLLKDKLTAEGRTRRLDLLKAQRGQDVTRAVSVIRRRIDAAGIREISVQTGSHDGRIIAQVPIKNILLTPAEIVVRLRNHMGAAKWDPMSQAEKDESIRQEERRLRREQLELDVSELQRVIEMTGRLIFLDVDACGKYQRSAQRWEAMLEWDNKLRELRGQLEAVPTADKAKHDELSARIAALEAKHPAPGFMIRELKEIRDNAASDRDVSSERLLLREKPLTTGDNLTRAIVIGGEGTGHKVLVYLDAAGGRAMENHTDKGNPMGMKHGETRMAIMLDGVVKSAPTINDRLSSNFEITGRFTKDEADQLAQVLNGGSLAFKPVRESMQVVGPGLGEDSISAGLRASLVGAILVLAFMACYYLSGGLAANLALGLNILLILGAMSLLGATMTLPGIAGIALAVGMAVDANVLIFERVREEKARGKPLKLALKAGQDRALITILDSNFTTMIIAFFLYLFGTGTVKGFAVTLTLGLLTNLFTALYVTKAVMEYLHGRGWVTEFRMMKVVGVPKIPFMRLSPAAAMVSALLVAGSIFLFVQTPNKYGLDFTGGLEVQVQLAEAADTARVRKVADAVKERMEAHLGADREIGRADARIGEFGVQAYEPDAAGKSRQFRVSCQLSTEQQQSLDKAAGKAGVKGFFGDGFGAAGIKLDATDPFPMMSRIGSRAAGELLGKAVLAFSFSLLAMFFYIVVRFDFMIGFGLGAAVTLFHDAMLAAGALMLANRMGLAGAQIDLVIVAALLTIIGFSINDTIVIFDRIRENRAAMRSAQLSDIIDLSINQTLSRTVLTSFTVFISTACLLILGGGTLRPFALVFMVGIIVGTYSSIVAAWVGMKFENWREARRELAKQRMRAVPGSQTA
ncbi:MAG TPA: protein translocase subunit SecD [Planctomycetota bacterium]|nr:protein translocase subunit SecD [Planctomycetota bacterium]